MITCILESGRKTSLRHVVVHAIVEKEGQLLLIKRNEELLKGGKWALPGGFLDRGETAAEGALRELVEETGWEADVISLFRINTDPNRPAEDRQNIALEFIVKPLRQVQEVDKESTAVRWVKFGEVATLGPLAFDHGKTIRLYAQYRQKHFPLPLLD